MGKKSKIKSKRKGNPKALKGNSSTAHVESKTFVTLAEEAVSQMQIENALGYYEQALSIDTLNCNIMESLADLYLSIGERDRALDLLLKSVHLSPDDNPEKYMYIAQLQQGDEALASYNRAVHYLSISVQEGISNNTVNSQLIKCYCGIAELYLTDLCYCENAEKLCEDAVASALKIDSHSVDANHSLANFLLSQNNPGEASIIVEKIYHTILNTRQRINSRTIVEDFRSPQHDDQYIDETDIPSLEICISTVKLMVECAAIKPNLAEEAILFAAELLNDNDENVEVWYIAGVAAMSTVPPDFQSASYYFEHARAMIDSFRELPDFETDAMEEQYRLILDHLSMVHHELQEREKGAGSEAKATNIEEEIWSSDDDQDN